MPGRYIRPGGRKMGMRRVPPPKLKGPWEHWTEAVLEAIEAKGSWSGSYVAALEAAKRRGTSARDMQTRTAQGWDTPETLLARWLRLHRLDWEAVGDILTVKARAKAASKVKGVRRPEPPAPPGLFDNEE
jgi:hypothetical protein